MDLGKARKGGFIKRPEYEKDDKNNVLQVNIPDPDFFLPIGYDRIPGDGTMHYRYYVDCELEDFGGSNEKCRYIDKSPFSKYHLFRG